MPEELTLPEGWVLAQIDEGRPKPVRRGSLDWFMAGEYGGLLGDEARRYREFRQRLDAEAERTLRELGEPSPEAEAAREEMYQLLDEHDATDPATWPEEDRRRYQELAETYWADFDRRLKRARRRELRKERRLAAGGTWPE
ncbi:MAG: hypothetical protein IRY83_16860 [Chloroflexi bacterium]|nr:hypothetical protein [Chloroflexota bacterium]